MKKILVTGGAGFIGSHLVDALLKEGHSVRVFDNLEPQVHGSSGDPPDYLNSEAEFIHGDVRDRDAVARALAGIDVVYHEAALVGVGQSMYRIQPYCDVNSVGTAVLLEEIISATDRIEKMVLASSMSLYGEGKYDCGKCGVQFPNLRETKQLEAKEWEVKCPSCGGDLSPLGTDEEKPLFPLSIYATTKRDQEEMFCQIGLSYDIPTAVLRYFNAYGPRQALANPYTGVVAIFSNCVLAGTAPIIFEDGCQTRDFTNVDDIVQANLLALEKHHSGVDIYNVGTGIGTSLVELTQLLYEEISGVKDGPTTIHGQMRAGDIRHCHADISKIQSKLGFKPSRTLREGVSTLAEWIKSQSGATDLLSGAVSELKAKGLLK